MKIQVCTWKSCKSNFSEYIIKRLKADLDFHKLSWIIIEESMCMGKCKYWPNIKFDKDLMTKMDPIKASKFMLDRKKGTKKTVKNNKK
jgi:NADH:ubiquinone oxidoreductase subunit E